MVLSGGNEYAQVRPQETGGVAEDLRDDGPDQTANYVDWSPTDRRTVLLACLQEFDEPVTLPDLADEIAVRESGAEITEISGEVVKEIYLSLYHTDIPELAEADIVEYDQEVDLVSSTPGIDLEDVSPADLDR